MIRILNFVLEIKKGRDEGDSIEIIRRAGRIFMMKKRVRFKEIIERRCVWWRDFWERFGPINCGIRLQLERKLSSKKLLFDKFTENKEKFEFLQTDHITYMLLNRLQQIHMWFLMKVFFLISENILSEKRIVFIYKHSVWW